MPRGDTLIPHPSHGSLLEKQPDAQGLHSFGRQGAVGGACVVPRAPHNARLGQCKKGLISEPRFSLHLFSPITSLIPMAVSTPRRLEALYSTCLNLIYRFGKSNCVVIELTFRKHHTMPTIKRSVRRFIRHCQKVLPRMIAVPGFTTCACHVHILAIKSENCPKLSVLRKIARETRAKCGFSRIAKVNPIKKTPPQMSRYLAKNMGDTIEYLTIPPNKPAGQLIVYSGIPRDWRMKATSFTRLTPYSRRFWATMNRLAELAGTPIGDYKALESALCVRADRIRRIVFGLFNEIPMRAGKSGTFRSISDHILLRTFPLLRDRHANNGEGSDKETDNE